MSTELLHRSSGEISTEGRTLIGVAVPWNVPTWVRDPGKPRYLESFAPRSFDVTLRQNPEPRPLFLTHGHFRGESPIGTVEFTRHESALLFRAHVSKTAAGDEALELVNDGAMRSVSVGVKPLQERKERHPLGTVTVRTEVIAKELSLAATGFGQYEDARVLAVRAEPTTAAEMLARMIADRGAAGLMTPQQLAAMAPAERVAWLRARPVRSGKFSDADLDRLQLGLAPRKFKS